MSTVGLKLDSSVFTASTAKIIRKNQELSISQIQQIVLSNGYVFKCDYLDERGHKNNFTYERRFVPRRH